MPIQYDSLIFEHITVRKKLGFLMFHMGEFKISGPNAIDLLQYICSNDISKIPVGKLNTTIFQTKLRIVDDLIVYR